MVYSKQINLKIVRNEKRKAYMQSLFQFNN